jgi:hypothetical protein
VARAFLLIADIGGYTRFMSVHRINLAHAQDVVAQLLESVIDGAGKTLELAKLEGDAAFFYATLRDGSPAEMTRMREAIADIRRAFVARRERLVFDRVCSCDSCTQAGDLKLKFVSHVGEVAFQKVKHHRELAGVDVIVVHRLLKNSVPIAEYVLMSEPVHSGFGQDVRTSAVEGEEDLEGLGKTRTFYVDLDALAPPVPTPAFPPSWLRRLWSLIKMNLRSIPYILGVRRPCDGFRNVAAALGEASGAPPSLPAASLPATSIAVASRSPPPPREDAER